MFSDPLEPHLSQVVERRSQLVHRVECERGILEHPSSLMKPIPVVPELLFDLERSHPIRPDPVQKLSATKNGATP